MTYVCIYVRPFLRQAVEAVRPGPVNIIINATNYSNTVIIIFSFLS